MIFVERKLTYRSGFSTVALFASISSFIWLDLCGWIESMAALFVAKAVGRAIFNVCNHAKKKIVFVWYEMSTIIIWTEITACGVRCHTCAYVWSVVMRACIGNWLSLMQSTCTSCGMWMNCCDVWIVWRLTFFLGLSGLCGLESLECFCCWLGLFVNDWLRRLDTGVFSTDLKYFSCMESSLPPPKPSMFFLIGFGRGDDIKLPDRTRDTVGELESVNGVSG